MNLAGRCCEQGWGTPRDPGAAAAWYRRSAEGGYFGGSSSWATILLNAGELEAAAIWFQRAADGGSPAVRDAVIDILSRTTGNPALRRLAEQLCTSRGT